MFARFCQAITSLFFHDFGCIKAVFELTPSYLFEESLVSSRMSDSLSPHTHYGRRGNSLSLSSIAMA